MLSASFAEVGEIYRRWYEDLGCAERRKHDEGNARRLDECAKRAVVHLRRGEFARTLLEANHLEAFASARRGRRVARSWALRAATAALLRHRLAERALRDAEVAVERIGEPPRTPPDHRWREP